MRGEAAHEQHLLARFRVCAHDRVLGIRVARPSASGAPRSASPRRTRPRCCGCARSAVICSFTCSGSRAYASAHVHPDGVAAHLGCLPAAQHRAHRRALAPGRVAVECVLVVLFLAGELLVDTHQAGIVGIAARDRMVLELAEAPREGDVLGGRDVLVRAGRAPCGAAAARGSPRRACHPSPLRRGSRRAAPHRWCR